LLRQGVSENIETRGTSLALQYFFYSGRELCMKLFVLLIGMVLVLEGIPYVAAPEAMRDWLAKLSRMPAVQLRAFGLFAMLLGLIICVVVQKTSIFD
jgi:uncharacterized protein YjeT (DUF2065 family)